MSTADINRIMKEQYQVAEFERKSWEAMYYVSNLKGLLVHQKAEVIDELRVLASGTCYQYHLINGQMKRVPKSMNPNQYDNHENEPMKHVDFLINKVKEAS